MGNWTSIFFMAAVAVIVMGSIYLLSDIATRQEISYPSYSINMSEEVFSGEIQFYPSMRYQYKNISYNIADECGVDKRGSVRETFGILQQRTILTFYESGNNSDIKIVCSSVEPKPEQKGFFIAGEGGPEEIMKLGERYVILSGKVALYRQEKCDEPKIALHEILHALGFDHSNDTRSIMYPVTDCKQVLGNDITDEINRVYSTESLPDLVIESLNVTKAGNDINFEIYVGNIGLEDAMNSTLTVSTEKGDVKKFSLGTISLGVKKVLSVENLRIQKGSESVIFNIKIDEGQAEIFTENNRVELKA